MSYIFAGNVKKYDQSTALGNVTLKFTNEKTGDSFQDDTNSSGEFVVDLANFDRGWQDGQTIKVEIIDTDNTIGDWDFYIGTSHSNLAYNWQYISDLTEWFTIPADKSSLKINTTQAPNGVSGLSIYRSPS